MLDIHYYLILIAITCCLRFTNLTCTTHESRRLFAVSEGLVVKPSLKHVERSHWLILRDLQTHNKKRFSITVDVEIWIRTYHVASIVNCHKGDISSTLSGGPDVTGFLLVGVDERSSGRVQEFLVVLCRENINPLLVANVCE
jgi:hypothetical protein